jgi:hypothetical protein
MNTVPSIDDLLEGFIISLNNEIMPFLNNPKAVATAAMMQSLLQEVRQILPIFDVTIAEEHNQMTRTLRDVATVLGDVALKRIEFAHVHQHLAHYQMLRYQQINHQFALLIPPSGTHCKTP